MDIDEIFNVIYCTNSELQDLVSEVIEIVSLHHPQSVSPDANVAFADVLKKNVPKVRETAKKYNSGQLLDAQNNIFHKIEIPTVDKSLLIDILLHVEGFLNIHQALASQNCTKVKHSQECCKDCDHSSPTCKKCISNVNKPTSKCNHFCAKCKTTLGECSKHKVICCSTCKICTACNENFAKSQWELKLENAPCKNFMFLYCLLTLKHWRNLFAHISKSKFQKFIDKTENLENFEKFPDVEALFLFIHSAFILVMDFISDARFQPHALQQDKYCSLEENLKCIFERGEPFKVYILKNYGKIKVLWENQSKYMDDLLHLNEILKEQNEELRNQDEAVAELSQKSPKFDITITISRSELPTELNMFCYDDIELDGPLRNLFMEAFRQAMKDVFQLQIKKDYKVKEAVCDFQGSKEGREERCEIAFEVFIENAKCFQDVMLKEQISDQESQKSINMRQQMKLQVQKKIKEQYDGMGVKVGFKKWTFGSLVIKGSISISRGEFSEAQVNRILDIINIEATKIFEATNTSVVQEKDKLSDYSAINFKLGICLVDHGYYSKINEENALLTQFFMKNIGAALTEAFPLLLRSSNGAQGRQVQLTTTFFELTIPKNTVIHRYEVFMREGTKFEDFPKKKRRLVIETLVDINKDVFKHRPVYDGAKWLYTKEPLDLGKSTSFLVQIPDGDREQTFEIALTWSSQVEMKALHASVSGETKSLLSGLNVVLKHAAALSYVPVRRGFYQRVNVVDLKEGREMWPGFTVTVRPTNGWKLHLNINVSHAIFIKGIDVVKFLNDVTGHNYKKNMPLNDYQRKKFEKEIKGLKIETLHMPYNRKYRVNSVRRDASDKDTFELDDNTRITVSDYFLKEKSKALEYPWLPCLHVGSPEKTIYLPLEVCRIVEGQHCNKKITEEQTKLMIQHTAMKPAERKDDINRIVNKDLNFATDRYVKDFGFEVSNKMASVNGRVLPAPGIVYTDPSKPLTPKFASWRVQDKLHKSADIEYWGLVVFNGCLSEKDTSKFKQELQKAAITMGIGMERPVYQCISTEEDSLEDIVSDALQKTISNKQQLKLLVCVLPEKSSIYANLKRLCETQVGHEKLHPNVRHILKESGLSTQCILRENAAQANPVCLKQLMLKINTKMGGTNNNINKKDRFTRPYRVFEKPVMFMGADVTHPAGGNKTSPSIAAIVGSMDRLPSRYAVTVRVQRNHMEMIEDMKGVTIELLKEFNNKLGCFPKRIIMYRDGVSDGQFQQVLYWEMKAMQEACMEIPEDKYEPSITFIIIQKRHNTRFFPTDGNMDKSGNCLPGTTIDTRVCHPTQFDYYQFSHAGVQGTSRPTHYHVLWDDSNFTADELQSLSYMLCHLYARCTRSVSIPPPAYYAHLVAYRARFHLQEADSEETSTISDVGKRIEKMSLHDFGKITKPHPNMIHEMYFV